MCEGGGGGGGGGGGEGEGGEEGKGGGGRGRGEGEGGGGRKGGYFTCMISDTEYFILYTSLPKRDSPHSRH